MADSSSLCLPCGLCCNGVLFDHVDVMADEIPVATARGLCLYEQDKRVSFKLPCACYVDSACSIYGDRPFTCCAFQCALLRQLRNGAMDLQACLTIVHRARELIRTIQEETGASDSRKRIWDVLPGTSPESGVPHSLEEIERNQKVAQDLAALRQLCDQYFLNPGE
ncbi:MAG: hypothetical protein WCF84_05875 [Anaerolineae bacterium]